MRLAVIAVVVTLASCADFVPDVGPLLAGESCNNDDSDPTTPVMFSSQLRPLISRQMAGCSCHLPTSAGPGQATLITGLDLSSMASLRMGGNVSGLQIVVDMEPCTSIIYQKVSVAPPFGSRMPLNGPPFWSPDELGLLHDWIAEGALDN